MINIEDIGIYDWVAVRAGEGNLGTILASSCANEEIEGIILRLNKQVYGKWELWFKSADLDRRLTSWNGIEFGPHHGLLQEMDPE